MPTAVWLVKGTFATESRGDLGLRFLVLSGEAVDFASLQIGSVVSPMWIMKRRRRRHCWSGNLLEGVLKRCPEIGDRPKKVLSNTPNL